MKPETRIALAPIDRCTLIAHETVALICTDADALESAVQLREGMAIAASAAGLDEETAPLLCWIDREVESAREFAATGQDTPHLIDPDLLFPVPDARRSDGWGLDAFPERSGMSPGATPNPAECCKDIHRAGWYGRHAPGHPQSRRRIPDR